jgi:hypothetical protein
MNRQSRESPQFVVSARVRAHMGCAAALMFAFAPVGVAQAQSDPTQLTVIHAFTGADGKGPVASRGGALSWQLLLALLVLVGFQRGRAAQDGRRRVKCAGNLNLHNQAWLAPL